MAPTAPDRRISATALTRLLGTLPVGSPGYVALADAARRSILDGSLPLGTRVPSERELAEALGVHQSTATRVCDRLVGKALVERSSGHSSRREVRIDLTLQGRRIVHEVSAARRVDIEQIVGRIPPALRAATVEALTAFNDAAGEIPQPSWTLGWQ